MLERLVERVRNIHPNQISLAGLLLSVGAVASCANEDTRSCAPYVYSVGAFLDYVDGWWARKIGKKTKEGAVLDPMFDKIRHFSVTSLMVFNEGFASSQMDTSKIAGIIDLEINNPYIVLSGLASVTVDVVSQAMRGKTLEHITNIPNAVWNPDDCTPDNDVYSKLRANNYGKWKTGLQVASHIAYLSYIGIHDKIERVLGAGFEENYLKCIAGVLLTSAALGAIGIFKRGKA